MKENLPYILQIVGIVGGLATIAGWYKNNVSGWVAQSVAAAEKFTELKTEVSELKRRVGRLEEHGGRR